MRLQLQRILASRRFAGAEKLSRFLTFIVEKTLAGTGAEIKEYLVALEVYQRPDSYNPRVDSIVRVEASRLRTRLDDYYAAEGRHDPVRIGLRKGRYVPDFELQQEEVAATPPTRRPRWWLLAAVASLAIVLIGIWRIGSNRRQTPAMAVLPFEDLSSDAGGGRFAAGLGEEIADRLGRAGELRVASRTSAVQFKGRSDSLRTIGRQLGVGSVLEGSVRREGRRLRISVQLASTLDGFQLWSSTYDRTVDDSLAVQAEVAGLIEKAVRAALSDTPESDRGPAEARRLSRAGWDRLRRGTFDSMIETGASPGVPGGTFVQITDCIKLFERAVQADPDCASAHAGLAAAWLGAADFDEHALPHVRPEADRALAIDGQSPEAHAALGYLDFFFEWDFAGARREYLRVLESRPRDAVSTRLYADAAMLTGEMELPLARLRAFAAGDRDALAIHAEIGILLYSLRRFDELGTYAQSVQRDHPGFPLGYWLLGLAQEQRREFAPAEAAFRQCLKLAPGDLRASLALAHLLSGTGRSEEAQELLEALNFGQNWTIRAYGAALIAVARGDRGAALSHLERAYQQHYSGLAFMKVDPRFDAVRTDARFVTILKKMRL